jgi:4-hydroxybenzoate polyprenyltransferase
MHLLQIIPTHQNILNQSKKNIYRTYSPTSKKVTPLIASSSNQQDSLTTKPVMTRNYFPKSVTMPTAQIPMTALRLVIYHAQTLLLFTGDQLLDTVIPGTAFGSLAALSGHAIDLPEQTTMAILSRLPLVAGWLWLVILQFCLQNQRTPDSIEEDAINKPWRPMPSKRITRKQMTYLFATTYVMTAIVSFFLGVFPIFVVYTMLITAYNDFGGCDHSGTTRNAFCGAGFSCYFSGAMSIALGPNVQMGYYAWKWTLLITFGVLATTIQTQELRDEAGDRARGRRTLVTEMGRTGTLWTVIITVPFWSFYLPLGFFAGGWLTAILPVFLGGCLVATAIQARYSGSNSLDRRMYKLWCLWMFGFCPLPLLNALAG